MNDCNTDWDQWNYRTVCVNGWHWTEHCLYDNKRNALELFKLPLSTTRYMSHECPKVSRERREVEMKTILSQWSKLETTLNDVSAKLKCKPEDLPIKIKKVQTNIATLEDELDRLKDPEGYKLRKWVAKEKILMAESEKRWQAELVRRASMNWAPCHFCDEIDPKGELILYTDYASSRLNGEFRTWF